MCKGFVRMLLSIAIFICVVVSLGNELRPRDSYLFRNSLRTALHLEGIQDTHTYEDFTAYVTDLYSHLAKARPFSSFHYKDESGVVRLIVGLQSFDEPEVMPTDTWEPPILPNFTITAWTQFDDDASLVTGEYLIRKPADGESSNLELQGSDQSSLSCWAWKTGRNPTFEFGAHDYRGLLGPDRVLPQESVGMTYTDAYAPGRLNFEAVVVTETEIRFYLDAALQSVQPLNRPVTECDGNQVLVGGQGFGKVGELTMYAGALSATELAEIRSFGATVTHIDMGRTPFTPTRDTWHRLEDQVQASVTQVAALSAMQLATAAADMIVTRNKIEEIKSSAADTATLPAPLMNASATTCPSPLPSTCHLMTFGDAPKTELGTSGSHGYYELAEDAAIRATGSSTGRIRFDNKDADPPPLYYDPQTFPSWAGSSMTIAMFMKATDPGPVLYKYVGNDRLCWSMHITSTGLRTSNSKQIQEGDLLIVASATHELPLPAFVLNDEGSTPFRDMTHYRHVALVFDNVSNTIRGYYDGVLFHEVNSSNTPVSEMDCTGENASIVFGRSQQGKQLNVMEFQDIRMYPNVALSGEDIFAIAQSRKECADAHSPYDTDFLDELGRGCSWYESQLRLGILKQCSIPAQTACPVACRVQPPCFDDSPTKSTEQYVGNRVLRLGHPVTVELSNTCAAAGVDPLADCEAANLGGRCASCPSPFPNISSLPAGYVQGPGIAFGISRDADYAAGVHYLNPMMCDSPADEPIVHGLRESIDQYCSFPSEENAGTPFREQALDATTGLSSFTISFWAHSKHTGDLYVEVWASLFPPIRLVTVRAFGAEVELTLHSTCIPSKSSTARFTVIQGGWNAFLISLGNVHNDGSRGVLFLVNGEVQFGDEIGWCWDNGLDGYYEKIGRESHRPFIQGFSVHGLTLVAPLLIAPTARTGRQAQRLYYNAMQVVRALSGPSQTEEGRLTKKLEYDSSPFSTSFVVLGPPTISQTRLTSQVECESADFGEILHDTWWSFATTGEEEGLSGAICDEQHVCPDVLSEEEKSKFLGCRSNEKPPTFFGRPPLKGKFVEFLSSIVDSPLLVRNSTDGIVGVYETASFIDSYSTLATIEFVAFSSELGMAARVEVIADITSLGSFNIRELRAPKRGSLSRDVFLNVLGILLSTAALLVTIHYRKRGDADFEFEELIAEYGSVGEPSGKTGRTREQGKCDQGLERIRAFAWDATLRVLSSVDGLLLGVMPLAYMCWSVTKLLGSMDTQTAVLRNILHVPWRSELLTPAEKLQVYLNALDGITDAIKDNENRITLGILLGTLLFLHLLSATSAHPRISVLVQTLKYSSSDLFYLILLEGIFFTTFGALVYVCFGGEYEEVNSYTKSITALIQVTLGSLPEDMGDLSNTPMLFMLVFLAINFFAVLNFLIAIIVAGHDRVKADIETDDSERAITYDVMTLIQGHFRSRKYGWPSRDECTKRLSKMTARVVGVEQLEYALYDSAKHGDHRSMEYRASIRAFLSHYRNAFLTLRPENVRARTTDQDAIAKAVIDGTSGILCTAMRTQVPTPLEVVKQTHKVKKRRKNVSCRSSDYGTEPAPLADVQIVGSGCV